jgi:hypothetical protein
MLLWLEAQELVNAEEGTPLEVHVEAGPIDSGADEEGETASPFPSEGERRPSRSRND